MKARSVRRAAVIAGLMMLVLSSAGHAACGPGTEACEPAIEEARAKLERLFSSAYVTPHALVSLEKRDGRSLETRGRRMYEMRFVAVLNYPGDRLRCRKHLCPSCTTIWWKSTPPRRRQRSRAGFSSSRGRTAGARRARAAPVRSVGWAKARLVHAEPTVEFAYVSVGSLAFALARAGFAWPTLRRLPLLQPLDDPDVAHRAVAERAQRLRVAGAVVARDRLFEAGEFGHD